MPTIKTNDGAEIFYKDWSAKNGSGQPIVFHHGWPLSADDWDTQMLFFLNQGYRVIAHDRRGHGRSSQTAHGHDMDTYAADVAAVATALDLRDVIHVGHSTGGGEATPTWRARQRAHREPALSGAVPPVMLKSASNQGGTPIEVFDGLRTALAANRASFYWDFTLPFYSYNREGAAVNEQVRHNWLRQADGRRPSTVRMHQGVLGNGLHGGSAVYRCPRRHHARRGRSDCAHRGFALLAAKLVKQGTLKVYLGLPHGMCTTHAERINPDLLGFIKA